MKYNMLPIETKLSCRDVHAHGHVHGAIVWLHGLGASADDFVPLVPYLKAPHLRFLFPEAPLRQVTVNGGASMPAWYDIKTIRRDPGREDERDIEEATRSLNAILTQLEEQGLPSQRIVLAGFSQGAAMALQVGLRYPRSLAGLLVLSGYLVLEDRLSTESSEANKTTPILFCHGLRDPIVPLSTAKASYRRLQADPRDAQWLDYAMGHEVCDEQVTDIRNWLHQQLPTPLSAGSDD